MMEVDNDDDYDTNFTGYNDATKRMKQSPVVKK